ncbi:MAG: response regulator transcription factor [Chloroflexota bacterium]
MDKKIQVMLVDDQRLMRDGIRTLLELEADFEVCAEVENGHLAVETFPHANPDVVLMDIRMPLLDGVQATKKIKSDWPHAKILILTTFDEDEYVFEGIRAGAMGYLLKDLSGEELANAIRTIAAGGALIGPEIAQKVMQRFANLNTETAVAPQPLPEPLSSRELEILNLMAGGFSNPMIARKLHLAEGTVKNYVSGILQKMNVRDRTQAVVYGKELGLI